MLDMYLSIGDRYVTGKPKCAKLLSMSDVQRFYNKEQIAERLGVTIHEVRRRQRAGTLPPPLKKGENKELLWSRTEIDSIALRRERNRNAAVYTPEQAALVFEAFEKGHNDIHCVVDLKVPPAAVKALKADYADLKGCLFVTSEVLKQINDMELDGPFPLVDQDDLLIFVQQKAAEKCGECHKRHPTFCKACVQTALKKVSEKAQAQAQGVDEL